MTKSNEDTYHDRWLDRLLIQLLARKMAQASGKTTHLTGYDALVDLSQQIMHTYDFQGQQTTIAQVLRSLIPAPVLVLIRTLFDPTQRILEWNAWFASRISSWLVGPCELKTVEIMGTDGQLKRQRSGIQIKKCRYLEQSGCVGMCTNLCKLPTQSFFAQEFGFPLTLTPNFDDLSCEMVFGQIAPPLTTETVYDQPCLVGQCNLAQPQTAACPQVRAYAPIQRDHGQ